MMYWLSKLIGSMVIVPGLLVLLALTAVWAVYASKRHLMRAITPVLALLLYTLSVEPVAEWLIAPLESWHPPLSISDATGADYILVLGGGVIDHSPEYGGVAVLAPEPLKRVDYALFLHQQLRIPLIFSGGASLGSKPEDAEAIVSRRYSIQRGIPTSAIMLESTSLNTDENFFATKHLYSPKRAIIVTSAFHMPRAVMIAAQHGMDNIPAPTDYKIRGANYTMLSFLPDKYALQMSAIAVKEYVGLSFYLVMGLLRTLWVT